jgi:peroxiredoxin Q/BCP
MVLRVGEIAPGFEAPDQNGTVHTLNEYHGKWILLYFYPKDDTPGCTTEACGLRDNFAELSKHLEIIGVSADTVASHKKFEEKYHLPFTILADPEKKILQAYGTDGTLFAKRTSFLINPEGKIVKIYEKVKPDVHAREIIADFSSLAKS